MTAHQRTRLTNTRTRYPPPQLERLEVERHKLEEEQKAFAEHLTKLRRAKHQDEFDRFMAERNLPSAIALHDCLFTQHRRDNKSLADEAM